MDIDRQADFLMAAFDAWWNLDATQIWGGQGRALALAAFSAGILATDSLLTLMGEAAE